MITRFLLGLLPALTAAATGAGAAVLEVSPSGAVPYTSIQAAIDAAVPGVDSVSVLCGTYEENLVMRDGVSVSGHWAECVVVDGGGNGPVVAFVGVGPDTVLENVTLRNGLADFGAGIYIEDSAPQVRRNKIVDNSTTAFGSGGGLFVFGDYFSAETGAAGPIITANLIAGNLADQTGGGIALYVAAGVIMENNLVVQNHAGVGGGGIDVQSSSAVVLSHNTIADNCTDEALSCDSGGGGIRVADSAGLEARNTLIAFNEASFGGGGVDAADSTVAFLSSDTYGNTPANFAGIADPTGADGNVSVHPLFDTQTPSFDGYRSRSHSFVIDGASDAPAPPFDINGVPRPKDGDASAVATADIGAHEIATLSRMTAASDANTVFWDPGLDTPDYNLYRGDLATLRATGEYTQDPALIPNARQWCGLTMGQRLDVNVPPPGEGYFYLSVILDNVEGSLGLDSSLQERAPTPANACF